LTVEYTKELAEADDAFTPVEFDTLENFLDSLGGDIRGYKLKNSTVRVNFTLEDVAELPEFNGAVIYHADPVLQFNAYTARCKELPKENVLRGGKQFAAAAKIQDGDRVLIDLGDKKIERVFRLDEKLKGTVALNPTFDIEINPNRYRFEKTKIERVQS